MEDCTDEPVLGYMDADPSGFRNRLLLIARERLRGDGLMLDRVAMLISKAGFMLPLIFLFAFLMIYQGQYSAWLSTGVILLSFFAIVTLPAMYLFTRSLWIRSRIVRDLQCFRCGYSLRNAKTDDQGFGRCPECGRRFNEAEYRKPPEVNILDIG
ncbi:MAG: hypothetical protein O7G85_14215 [Planctomycetota bacterium]|nr:hypothetical protein [Planctomycetota bacterium]